MKKLCGQILSNVQEGFTELHIEPFGNELRVRGRRDGVLSAIMTLPLEKANGVVAEFKLLASMSIDEKRLPMDGIGQVKLEGTSYFVEVSSVPVSHQKGQGEKLKIVLYPDSPKPYLKLSGLGLEPAQIAHFKHALENPHGMILATGHFLSGKSTTLYACLAELDSEKSLSATAEYSPQNFLPGVTQIEIKPEIGLSMASALRLLVRHKVENILLGDMLDLETAELAFRASLTGHLILAPTSTECAAAAFGRLGNKGIDPYYLTEAILLVANQRLVRKICPACKIEKMVTSDQCTHFKIDSDLLRRLEFPFGSTLCLPAYEGKGCDRCGGTGYQGVTGVFEVLPTSPELKKLVLGDYSKDAIRKLAAEQGMLNIREAALKKVLQGITTFGELIRRGIDHT